MRDLKPENILLSADKKSIKLCDFGWASYINDKKWLLKMAGTYAYMAPEVLQGRMQGFETDIWALGILLYEMYHGYEPFKARTPDKILQLIQSRPIKFDSKKISKEA